MFIEIPDSDRPLCPTIGWPGNPAHQLHNRTLDEFYKAAEKSADGELTEAVEGPYNAAAYGQVSDRMHLYREAVSALHGGTYVVVEAWWFKCPTCGCILPAQGMQRR